MQNFPVYLFSRIINHLCVFIYVFVRNNVAQYFIAEIEEGLSCNWSCKLRCAHAFSAHIYDSIQKRNKTLSAVVSVSATKRWVSSSFLGVHDIYSYGTLKGHGWAVWNNLWSSAAWSLFIHPEQIYRISLRPTAGRGKKNKKAALMALLCSLKSCHEQPS